MNKDDVNKIASKFGFKGDYPLVQELESALEWSAYKKGGLRASEKKKDELSPKAKLDRIISTAAKLQTYLREAPVEIKMLFDFTSDEFVEIDRLLSMIEYTTFETSVRLLKAHTNHIDAPYFFPLMKTLRRIYTDGTGQDHWISRGVLKDGSDNYSSPYHQFVMTCLKYINLEVTDSKLHDWLKKRPELRNPN